MTTPRVLLCKASAGSGKTFKLAKSFVRILLERPHEYDRILAVTFTNKATEEMKSRILSFLTQLSQLKQHDTVEVPPIAKSLREEMPDWDYERMANQAAIALSNILHDFSHFSVLTLDSFFQRMIRAFVHELKLPGGANLCMDVGLALDAAVESLVNSYDKDDARLLNQWLKNLAISRLEDGKSWQPSDAIRALSKELFNEKVARLDIDYPIERIRPLYEQLKKEQKAFEDQHLKLVLVALKLIEDADLVHGWFSGNYMPKQLYKMADNPGSMAFSETVVSVIQEAGNPFPKKIHNQPEYPAALELWYESIQPACLEILRYFEQYESRYLSYKAVLKNLQHLALLTEVGEQMKRYREENGIMLISDNGQLIHKIVQASDAPFLYEKLGNKYRYILLDEFQDTSTLQWENLLPLITEVLAHAENCQLLIVGDAKQSIYRWRNGNLKLILSDVQRDLQQYWSYESTETLTDNYRSRKAIVDFNNQLFPLWAKELENNFNADYLRDMTDTFQSTLLTDLYNKKDTPQNPQGADGGYVELRFFRDTSRSQEPDEYQELLEDHLLDCIARLQQNNYSLSDICILVRDRKDGKAAAQMLKANEIDVLTDEALLFENDRSIKLLIAALRWLENPEEALHKAAVLHHYNHLHRLPIELPDRQSMDEHLSRLIPELSDKTNRQWLIQQPLSDLISELIELLNVQAHRSIYTEQFLDQVAVFSRSALNHHIRDFMEWWEQQERFIQLSGDADAVRIMTIHRSKGLEFKAVIVPYFNWKLVETNNVRQALVWAKAPEYPPLNEFELYPVYFNDAKQSDFHLDYQEEAALQTADNLNLAYVAFTRASEVLFVMGKIASEKQNPEDGGSTMAKMLYAHLHRKYAEAEDNFTFSFGELTDKLVPKTSSSGHFAPHRQKLELPDGKTENAPQAVYGSRYQSEEARHGSAVHDVAAQYRPGDSIEKVVTRVAANYLLNPEEMDRLETKMQQFFSQDAIAAIYQSDAIYNERNLLSEEGKQRFDMLCRKGDEWHLYDFKTGQPTDKDSEQIQNYKAALQTAGIEVSSAALIYIQSDGTANIETV